MKNNIQKDIYLDMSQQIMENVPNDWDNAFIEAEIHRNNIVLTGGYSTSDLFESFLCERLKMDMSLLFKNLHNETYCVKNNRWNKVRFYLDKKGKFKVDFFFSKEINYDLTSQVSEKEQYLH